MATEDLKQVYDRAMGALKFIYELAQGGSHDARRDLIVIEKWLHASAAPFANLKYPKSNSIPDDKESSS